MGALKVLFWRFLCSLICMFGASLAYELMSLTFHCYLIPTYLAVALTKEKFISPHRIRRTDSVFCCGFGRFQRAKPIIIDPGLYMDKKTDIFWATQRRAVPTAFRLFTGIFLLSKLASILKF